MTKYQPIYAQGGTYNAKADRTPLTNLYSEGILGPGSFAVTQRALGANFTVDIAAGVAVVTGDVDADQGRYWCRETAATTGTTITSVPTAGNERYDRVILEVRDDTEDSSTFTDWRFRVVAGTPASVGTAVAPALPAHAITLAVIGPILNGTTAITNSLIVDSRTAARLAHQVVDTSAIVDANVTTAKIADLNVTTGKIADSAVTSTKIANGTIVEADLATAVLSSSWATLSASSSWTGGTAQYKKIGNVAFVNVTNATRQAPLSNTYGTLPVGFRPSSQWQAIALCNQGGGGTLLVGRIWVATDGTVNMHRGAASAGDVFDGFLSFPV